MVWCERTLHRPGHWVPPIWKKNSEMMSTANRPSIRSALLVLVILGLLQPHPMDSTALTWSTPTAVESSSGFDQFPTALQASNGALWLAWASNRFNTANPARFDILYKTMTGGIWSDPARLSMSGNNQVPGLAQLKNNTILLFWTSIPATSFHIYYKRFNNGIWSNSVQLTSGSLNNTLPSAAVGRDGTLWLTWTRMNRSLTKQLFYRTLTAGVWSPEALLTSDANWNLGSSVTVGKDGKVRVVWSKGPPSTVNFQTFYKTYDGTGWGPEAQITFPGTTDQHPSILQDRNGTIWLSWQRKIFVSPTITKWAIFTKSSTDNWLTWSAETQITDPPCSPTQCFNDEMPAAVQSTGDKSIWVFTSSTAPGSSGFDIYAVKSSPVSPVHDVTVSTFNTSSILQYPGGLASVGQSPLVTISVTILNLGDLAETVQVSLTVFNITSYSLGPSTVPVVAGGSVTVFFDWNTTGVKPGRYGISASVIPVPGETVGSAGDNSLSERRRIHILPLGDLDQNGAVTLTDVSVFFYGFGFSSTCGCSRWNPFADINNTGTIDIIDVGIAVRNFGVTT